jgi:hypothetical protein
MGILGPSFPPSRTGVHNLKGCVWGSIPLPCTDVLDWLGHFALPLGGVVN